MEKSERLGLSVAVVGHVALFAVLSLGIASRPELKMPTDPIAVQLTDEVGLVSTAPKPVTEAATATAPEVAPEIEKAQAEPEPTPAPPVKRPEPPAARAIERPTPPKPKAEEKPQPKPVPKPVPKPARASPPPPAKPQPKAADKPKPAPSTNADSRRRPDRPTPAPAAKAPRAPRIGSNFLDGVTDKPSTSRAQTPPAAAAGPAVQASLANEVRRQLKPHWQSPTGADIELLRTELELRLAEDGTLIGEPRLVRQTGVTDSNRSQARLHVEQAIKAAKLAAPFQLPAQYYDTWKVIRPVFDKRL